jgi:hypothetical protein
LLLPVCASGSDPRVVWWEAETPAAGSFPPPEQNPAAPRDAEQAALLSGGAWVGVAGIHEAPLFLEYSVAVPREATWTLWCRKFWRHGPFRWRFDDGPWTECPFEIPLADAVPIAPAVMANWVRLGDVALAAGGHRIRVELLDRSGQAAFDCFVLADGPFHPNGPLRPGQKYGRAPEGWFPFEPGVDPLTDCPIDLSGLGHRVAGEMGWARPRGKDVIFEREGRPTRFWGVTICNEDYLLDDASADRLAARLAKAGVNLVRMHLDFDDDRPNAKLDRIQYFVAAMKRRGIYTYLGFFCTAVARVQPKWNLPELPAGKEIQGLLFTYPPLQERYKSWARCLFNSPSPYAPTPLGRDPAVLGIELMDEDNLTFWTFQPYDIVPEPAMREIEKAFGLWLARRHGSVEQALAAWGPGRPPPRGTDDPASGRVALYPAGTLTGNDWAAARRNEARARDQVRFFTEHLRAFWGETARWLREETGYGGIVVATNWKTADERVLGPLDKFTLRACDATAENNYFGPELDNPSGLFPYGVGASWADLSALATPMNPVLLQAQFDDAPHFWTEGAWETPNRFRTEMPLLLAGYFSLQGIDGLALFTLERDWNCTIPKWPVQTPACIGQFPAAALIYRTGMIEEGPIVIHEALRLEDLYRLEGCAFGKPLGLDPAQAVRVPLGASLGPTTRDEASPSAGASAAPPARFDPLAFYAGRVTRTVADEPGAPVFDPRLATLIDRGHARVTSATGQLVYDYGRGLAVIDAPRAQGFTGFGGAAGELRTTDASFRLENDYGAVVLVALDNRPLRESRRMLLQVMSEEKNYGWRTARATRTIRGEPREVQVIESVGGPPIVVRRIHGRVSLLRPDAAALGVTALDFNGYPRQPAGTAAAIELLPDALHYLIAAKPGA